MPKDKRIKVGGVIAARSMRAKVGKVLKSFPPSVLMTEEERRTVTRAFSEERSAKGALKRATKAPPVPSPDPVARPQGEAPARSDVSFPVLALLRRVAHYERVPAELRLEAFKLIT